MSLVKIGNGNYDIMACARKIMTNKSETEYIGLTEDENILLRILLGKIQFNHCKNYNDSRFGWTCVNKFDNQVCPFEYKNYSGREHPGHDFYCPVFLIRNVLEGKWK